MATLLPLHDEPLLAAAAEAEVGVYTDVRGVLPLVQAPTLVLYRRDDLFAGRPHAEYLAAHIPGARLAEVPGADNFIFAGDSDTDLDEIEEFLPAPAERHATDRCSLRSCSPTSSSPPSRFPSLVITDGETCSTPTIALSAGNLNDSGARGQHRRRRVSATFDGPGRAIECDLVICEAVRSLGIEVRAGLHTGEIEVRGADVAGLAVHIGARVAAAAGPGEVLVSGAVRPLLSGLALPSPTGVSTSSRACPDAGSSSLLPTHNRAERTDPDPHTVR